MKTHSDNPEGGTLRHLAGRDSAVRDGRFTLEGPPEVIAGAPVTLALRYTCGARSLRAGDTVAVAWRLPCDWGEPQWRDPAAPNYVTAEAPDGIEVSLQYEDRGGIKPWHHLLSARVTGGTLVGGRSLRLLLGGRSGGSRGWDAQTAAVREHRFLAMLRRAGDEDWLELPGPAPLPVLSGRAASMVVAAPSDAVRHEPVPVVVRMMDRWGNPSRGHAGDVEFSGGEVAPGSMRRLRRDGASYDVWHAAVRFAVPGVHTLVARAGTDGLVAESNPVVCHAEPPAERAHWGDLHAGQGELGCGQGSLEDFFWYARHVAGLRFASHQANDVYVTAEDWAHTRRVTAEADEPGVFTAFLGCEWTARPPAGGDRNVFYLHDQPVLHRAARWHRDDVPDGWSDAADPNALHRALAGAEALINLHAGGFPSDLSFADARLERLVEVHSTHGTSDWLVEAALEQGRRIGVCGATDGIAGRPGACLPGRRTTRNLPNGCLAAWAATASRVDLWAALRAGRVYGTDGERIRLEVSAGPHQMGDAFTSDAPPPLTVDVAGTAPIERVTLRCGARTVQAHEAWVPDAAHPNRYRVKWCGTRQLGAAHDQRLDWSGTLTTKEGALRWVATTGHYGVDDAVEAHGAETLAFRSVTAGNPVGFVFDAAVPPGARLTFRSGPVGFEFALPSEGVVRHALPPASGRGHVEVARAPAPDGARRCTLRLDLPDEGRGTYPYWVEVLQSNGSRAWSSPIYLTRP